MGDMLSTIKEYQNTFTVLSDKLQTLDKDIAKLKRNRKGQLSILANMIKRRDDLALQLASTQYAINSMMEYQTALN